MLQVFLAERELGMCASLRRVICSGEALPFALQSRFFARLDAELHNLYGPTEAAIDVTYWACPRMSDNMQVPIGKPIANTQIYLLDERLQPVPIGVAGELHIGGVGLARGYLHRPGLSAEKFMANPFSKDPAARLYKTGDLARYLPDGDIEYLGRLDDQVKLRGFRIELSEIEVALRQCPEVQDAVVVTRDTPSGDRQLIAYVVATPSALAVSAGVDAQPDRSTLASALRRYLQQKLPDYMVPAVVVILEVMPLSPNGKVDRKALPLPEATRVARDVSIVPPRTPEEACLLSIWCQTLGIEPLSIHDHFFELGGHSLQAMKLVMQASAELHRDIPVHALFLHPTVVEFAQALDTFPRTPSSPTPLAVDRSADQSPMQPSSPFTTFVRHAIYPGLAAGDLAPVHAAALAYLPVSLLGLPGMSRDLLLRDWCNHQPCVASLLETSWGRLALIVLPIWSDEIYRDPDGLTEVALDGLALAGQIGAQTVSLTGLLPSATDYGRTLTDALSGRRNWPEVSTGHATTTSAMVFMIDKLLHEGGRHLAQERVGFLGLGSIGRTALDLMLNVLPHPDEILLCDVYAKRQALETLAETLRENTGFQGRLRVAPAGADVPAAFYEATLIVGATNVPDILDVARLRPGTLVVDDSAPHCFNAERAVQRFEQHRDLLFTEGGIVRSPHPFHEVRYVPRAIEQHMEVSQFDTLFARHDPHEIMGCTLSSLLSSRLEQLRPTIGFVDSQTSQQYYGMLKRLGIEAARLQCDNYVLDDEARRAFRQQFRAS